jgi:hypothetical protein
MVLTLEAGSDPRGYVVYCVLSKERFYGSTEKLEGPF